MELLDFAIMEQIACARVQTRARSIVPQEANNENIDPSKKRIEILPAKWYIPPLM
jgi:hypothetical protein